MIYNVFLIFTFSCTYIYFTNLFTLKLPIEANMMWVLGLNLRS